MSLTDAQITARVNSLGGSDAAAIVGLSPWKTADQLLREKAGLVPISDDDRFVAHREWGDRLEAAVRCKTEEELGPGVWIQYSPDTVFVHDTHLFLTARPDGLIRHYDKSQRDDDVGLYEGKTTSYGQKKDWQTVPPHYHIQCVHNMMVCGCVYAVLAVLIGGNDYRMFRIERDDEECDLLLTLEVRFWAKVLALKGTPVDE